MTTISIDFSDDNSIDPERRCQVISGYEKTIIQWDGFNPIDVKSKRIHAWYSHGWLLGTLTETLFAARIFNRFTVDAQPYVVKCETENLNDLKTTMFWVRDMTRALKGRWSVAGQQANFLPSWRPPSHEEPTPLEFSFEFAEDAVKFKMFGDRAKIA